MEPARRSTYEDAIAVPALEAHGAFRGLGSAKPATFYQQYGKRLLDMLLSALAIVVLSPVLLCIAVAILVTSGWPVCYRSRRVGASDSEFWMLKFRTMRRDADVALASVLKNTPLAIHEFRERRKIGNDPRVTTIGKFLRASSLDELPQLFNTLTGTMSLVGPRPVPRPELEEKYGSLAEAVFFDVRPGMTGLWQVSGRSNTSYEQRIRYDCEYLAHTSFANDLRILARTAIIILTARGAE